MADQYLREYASKGSWDYDHMVFEIAAAKNVNTGSDSMIAWAADGIQQACDQLYNYGYISGYDIDLYETTLEINDGDNVLDKWKYHRDDQGWTHDGSWLLCHKSNQGSSAGGSDAWKKENGCHVSKDVYWGYGLTAFKSFAIHESFHNFLQSGRCSKIQNNHGVSNDHQLGDDFGDSYIFQTPMVGGHQDETTEGDCNTDKGADLSNASLDLNYCEKDAIQLSADHSDGQH